MKLGKISIIGAGNVGSNLAFLLLVKKVCSHIVLVDVQRDLAEALALDLEDSRYFFGADISVKGTDDFNESSDSDIVVVTCGKARSPGEAREDLITINSAIIKDVGGKIKETSPESKIIVVTNPLDIMTYIILHQTGFNRKRVMGMGSGLDSSRLANLMSRAAGVSINNISPVVFGVHGRQMLVSSLSGITAGQKDNFLSAEDFADIQNLTAQRGAAIVKLLKTGSARFAPAAALKDLVESIEHDKKKLSFASVNLNGEYGLKNICLGMPVIIGSNGIEKIVEFDLPAEEKEALLRSEEAFRKNLKLI